MRIESRVHAYQPFLSLNGQTYDTGQQMLIHGLVSPKYAAEHGIPFQKRSSVSTPDVPQEVLDDVIYLYSLRDRAPYPLPATPYVYVKDHVPTLSIEEMQKLHPGWASFSTGEIYAFGRIAPEDLVWPE